MGSSPRERFAGHFRDATPSERRRFLADLWAARGWETTVEETHVVAHRDTQTKRIAVVSGGWFGLRRTVPDDADVLVALGPVSSPDARVFTLDDIYEQVRYGVPVDVGDRLVEGHFGVNLDDSPAPTRWTLPDSQRSVVAVVVAVALFVGVLAVAGVPDVVPNPSSVSDDQVTAVTTTPSTPGPDPDSVAPGLTTAGVENATRLAVAHRQLVTNQTYTWTIGYRESIADDETGRVVEVVRVEQPHVYVSEIQRVGSLRAFPRPTASEDTYADGRTRYARRPTEADGLSARVIHPDVLAGPGRQATRADRYVDWYLSSESSRVVNSTVDNGTTVYRIEGRGNDFPRSRAYDVVAFVEEDGFVRSMQASYETRDGLGVTVWFEYEQVGHTTVERPPWVDRFEQSPTQSGSVE